MSARWQRQVFFGPDCADTLGDSQLQILDKFVVMPVVLQQQMPRIWWRLHSCCSWFGFMTCPLLCNDRCRRTRLCRESLRCQLAPAVTVEVWTGRLRMACGRLRMAHVVVYGWPVGHLRMARGRLRMARGRLRMARGHPRMACGRLRMANVSQRVVCGWPGVVYGWPVVPKKCRLRMATGSSTDNHRIVYGRREVLRSSRPRMAGEPIGSRKAAMYHCTSKWERGPPPPGRLRMAHWSSADRPTGARCLVVQVVQVPHVQGVEDTVEIPRLPDRGEIVEFQNSSWRSDIREFGHCTCPLGG